MSSIASSIGVVDSTVTGFVFMISRTMTGAALALGIPWVKDPLRSRLPAPHALLNPANSTFETIIREHVFERAQIVQQSLHKDLQASLIELRFNVMFAHKL
jgi:hypothetical protein